MDSKEKYESLCKEIQQLKKKMICLLVLALGVLLLMIVVLVILYFAFPQLLADVPTVGFPSSADVIERPASLLPKAFDWRKI